MAMVTGSTGDDGTIAVAAAELVAAINGQPIDESAYNEGARQWISRGHVAALSRSQLTAV
jgi:hypothetical protein